MRTIIAYVLVVPTVQFCLVLGVWIPGFLIALLLAWAPISVRTSIAGVCGGVAGVALAVLWGYGVFHFIVGPGSFTLAPFLASTLPLLGPICRNWIQARQFAAARMDVLKLAAERGPEVAAQMAHETQTAHGSVVAGMIVGLLGAVAWEFGCF